MTTTVKGGQWPKPTFVGRDIAGTLMGLIGYGAIGRETAAMLAQENMTAIDYVAILSAAPTSPACIAL